jgi:hypothetical protein
MRFAVLAAVVACASACTHAHHSSTTLAAGPFQGFTFKTDRTDTRELGTSGVFVKRTAGWRVPWDSKLAFRTVVVDLENRTKRAICVDIELANDSSEIRTWNANAVLKLKPGAQALHVAGRASGEPRVERVDLHWVVLDAWRANPDGTCDPKPDTRTASR